jgi:hypothetical protein
MALSITQGQKDSEGESFASSRRPSAATEDIDFDEIDEDLDRFQEDEMVKQALQKGIHLREYADYLENQLKEVQT